MFGKCWQKNQPINFVGLFILLLLCSHSFALATDDAMLYMQGVKLASQGNLDAAFLKFHQLVKICPDSKFKPIALFAIGEYYFAQKDYKNAKTALEKIAPESLESERIIFLYAQLKFIADHYKDSILSQKLNEKTVKLRSIRLVFSESKTFSYISSMAITYQANYYIDRIEIYRNKELLTVINLN